MIKKFTLIFRERKKDSRKKKYVYKKIPIQMCSLFSHTNKSLWYRKWILIFGFIKIFTLKMSSSYFLWSQIFNPILFHLYFLSFFVLFFLWFTAIWKCKLYCAFLGKWEWLAWVLGKLFICFDWIRYYLVGIIYKWCLSDNLVLRTLGFLLGFGKPFNRKQVRKKVSV